MVYDKREYLNIEHRVKESFRILEFDNFRTPKVQVAWEVDSLVLHDILFLFKISALSLKEEYHLPLTTSTATPTTPPLSSISYCKGPSLMFNKAEILLTLGHTRYITCN